LEAACSGASAGAIQTRNVRRNDRPQYCSGSCPGRVSGVWLSYDFLRPGRAGAGLEPACYPGCQLPRLSSADHLACAVYLSGKMDVSVHSRINQPVNRRPACHRGVVLRVCSRRLVAVHVDVRSSQKTSCACLLRSAGLPAGETACPTEQHSRNQNNEASDTFRNQTVRQTALPAYPSPGC
jgi:hypothetical protein